jgi:hypothetical protein
MIQCVLALFLDPEMQCSCARFPDAAADLAAAQRAKLDMICRKAAAESQAIASLGARHGTFRQLADASFHAC